MPEKGIRTDCPVYLGGDNALRHETSAHSHVAGLPVIHKVIDIQRGKQRDVPFFKIIHGGIAEPPVRHVYDCVRSYRIQGAIHKAGPDTAYRIHHVSCGFQGFYKLRRLAHLPGHDDARRIFFIKPGGFQIFLIFSDASEAEFPFPLTGRTVDIFHFIYFRRRRF